MAWLVLALFVLMDVPVLFMFWRWCFPTVEDFVEALRYYLTPNSVSLYRGEYMEDVETSAKLYFVVMGTAATIYSQYGFFCEWFPHFSL